MLHIFFLHYGTSLVVGGAMIVGLFLLGGGLQICSIVILLNTYSQPAITMLRRMDMYEVRAELRDGSYSPCEKIDLAVEAAIVKPRRDEFFFWRIYLTVTTILTLFFLSGLTIYLSEKNVSVWIIYLIVCFIVAVLLFSSVPTEFDAIRELKKRAR